MPKLPIADLNKSEAYKKAFDFIEKNEQVKSLNKEIAPLKEELKEATSNHGVVLDPNKGHQILTLEGSKGTVVLTNTCKVSTTLRPSALEVIKENFSSKEIKDLIEKVEIVRDDVLEQMVKEGKVPDHIVKKLYKTDDTYAFSGKIVK